MRFFNYLSASTILTLVGVTLVSVSGCSPSTEVSAVEAPVAVETDTAAAVATASETLGEATSSDIQFRDLVEFPKTPESPENLAEVFHECDATFHRKGLLVSPGLLKEFLTPGVMELDLFRPGHNRNDENFSVKRLSDGFEWAIHEETSLRYRPTGRSDRGVWVLRVEQPVTGDLGIGCRLFLVRVERATRPVFTESGDGKVSRRSAGEPTVSLRLVGEIELGDRDARSVTVSGEKILIRNPKVPDAEVTVNIPSEL